MATTSKNSSTSSSKKSARGGASRVTGADSYLILSVFLLIGVGLVQVYSSSFVFATDRFGDGLLFFKKQILFGVVGFSLLLAIAYMPPKWLLRFGVCLGLGSLLLLIGTQIPGLGVRVGGAMRWLQLPMGFRLEPSEFFKIGWPFIVVLGLVNGWNGWGIIRRVLFCAFCAIPFYILIRQPDFGSMVLLMSVLLIVLFVNGMSWKSIFVGTSAVAASGAFLVMSSEYRMKRVQGFIDPWSDASGTGFQTIQSMLGFYSGGLSGKGLGAGQSKLHFLPEAHTDFTLSVLGEELGFIGVAALLIFLGLLIFRSIWLMSRLEDYTKRIIGLALISLFTLQVFINFGVALGVLPTKGLTLPFLSYGGSSLIASCILFGILANLSREERV